MYTSHYQKCSRFNFEKNWKTTLFDSQI